MGMRLADRVAVITGGGRGIGLAAARVFVREGARVVLGDLDRSALDAATEELGPERALGLAVDVSRGADAALLVGAALERWGRIDVALNSAGIAAPLPATELSEEEWRRVVDVNLTGTFLVCQAAGRAMLERGSGAIVNLASMYGKRAVPNRAPYVASKFAVVGLTEALAVEWAPHVRVNALAPGYTDTELFRRNQARGATDVDALIARTPLGRLGRPEEIAEAALYLASDEAAWITGHTLVIDGGWTALGAELRPDRPAYPRGS
jgi:NAD(P)-dependent dehydrogenase (short-subunit alcohol dehydrogenase family)